MLTNTASGSCYPADASRRDFSAILLAEDVSQKGSRAVVLLDMIDR